MDNDCFLDNALLFIHILRRAGLPVSTEQAMEFCQALTLVSIDQPERVYFVARCLLINRFEHLRLFETLFNRFWRQQSQLLPAQSQKAPDAPRYDRRYHRPLLINYMANKANRDDPEIDVVDKSGTFSQIEILQSKDFSELTEEELQAVRRLIQQMRWQVSVRQTRRMIANPRGSRMHMRQVIKSAVRYGGVPLKLAWQSQKIKQRPIVLLADVSGSMEKYSRLILQFFYSVSHSLKDVECFVFGTRLTRITQQLKLKNIDRALTDAAHTVVDWSGGTRIGESLQQFNQQWSRRVLRRGAIVLIVSDGWERGDTQLLKKEMQYLQRRCHRIIWMNPLLGKHTYEPLVEGMATALKYVDDFLPIHNLQSLQTLAKYIESIGTH